LGEKKAGGRSQKLKGMSKKIEPRGGGDSMVRTLREGRGEEGGGGFGGNA